ncbi:hypothetical protein [Borrelia sp. HM]|uniref:hypothetical protein n=1 Tax=Borrelia sp. HM TaxID=1882662 RepID=UPI001C78017D|nr:hypothetical protein [Borrelia sp. HM]BCR21946.1 hypothetical protein BKFM_00523 [Borrelia sp. HM]
MKRYLSLSFFYLLFGIFFLFFIIFIQFRDLSSSVFFLRDLQFLANNKFENNKSVLDSLVISLRGIKINLSKDKPLFIPETRLNLYPVDYKLQGDAVYIYFANNIFLSFAFDSNDNFSISSNLSKKLIISYEIEGDYKILFDENITINGSDSYFEVILGKHSHINDKEISVSPQESFQIGKLIKKSKMSEEFISQTSSNNDTPLGMNSSDMYSLINIIDKKDFDSKLALFRDKAYDYWTNKSKFSVKQGGWLKDNVYSFNENIFVYLLAESLMKPNYEKIFLNLQSLIRFNQDKLTHLSVSYYADSEKLDQFFHYLSVNKKFIDSLELDKLLEYLKEDAYLLEKIFLSENISILNGALNILRNPEIILTSRFNLVQAYNVLSNYIIFLKFDNDNLIIGRLKEELTKFVSTLFSVTSNGEVYVFDDKSYLSRDLKYTLKIAGLLKRLAYQLRDDLMLQFTCNAIYYSLINPDVDQIPCEDYYADIVDNDYIPKFSLFPNLGVGNWIYGASKIVNFKFSKDFYSIDFERNLNIPGYFFFKGIEIPTLIKFRDISWFTDPQFYIYSDGWRYYFDNKMLVVKITPKKISDTNILLRFDNINLIRNVNE